MSHHMFFYCTWTEKCFSSLSCLLSLFVKVHPIFIVLVLSMACTDSDTKKVCCVLIRVAFIVCFFISFWPSSFQEYDTQTKPGCVMFRVHIALGLGPMDPLTNPSMHAKQSHLSGFLIPNSHYSWPLITNLRSVNFI